ncbi:unnamed protein product [Symbiodinium microadriaticum]|nr:unnamed protein product [Symbiodinium microadriaticum]CAE7949337.1 unnamed protein product [Symbiodinium sp. KB8]
MPIEMLRSRMRSPRILRMRAADVMVLFSRRKHQQGACAAKLHRSRRAAGWKQLRISMHMGGHPPSIRSVPKRCRRMARRRSSALIRSCS